MGVTAAIILAAGAAISAGVQAEGAHEAGKASAKAGAAANAQYRSDAATSAKSLDKYRKRLDNPGLMNLDAIKANLANFPQIQKLAQKVNDGNGQQIARMLQGVLPGYQKSVNRAMSNTASWIRGEVPADVAAAVKDRAAEKSLNFGFAGGPAGKALQARDLGTTSLGLMQAGENSLQRWLQTARTYLLPQPFDPTAMFVSPAQELNSVEAAAGIAKSQADMILGNANKGNEAVQAGTAAQIQANQAMYQAIGQGVSSISGAAAGGVMSANGAGAAGGGYQNYLNRGNGGGYVPGVVSTPNNLTYSYDPSLGWAAVPRTVTA